MTAAGRPRDPRVDGAILSATLELLGQVGYHQMSVEAVAARARVGKPTVYRRYPSKPALVAAAIASLKPPTPDPLPAETLSAIRVLMQRTAGALADPGVLAVLGTLVAEREREPELAEALRQRLFRPAIARLGQLLERGVERGEVRPNLDSQAVIDMLFGALLARAALGEPADGRWLAGVVDGCWRGIAAGARDGAGADSRI